MLNPFSFPGTCCSLHGLEHMLTHLCRRPFAITTWVVAISGCCDEPAHCHQIYSPTSFNNTCPGGSASRRVPVVTMRQRGKMTANSQMLPILSTLSLHHPAVTSMFTVCWPRCMGWRGGSASKPATAENSDDDRYSHGRPFGKPPRVLLCKVTGYGKNFATTCYNMIVPPWTTLSITTRHLQRGKTRSMILVCTPTIFINCAARIWERASWLDKPKIDL